MKILIAEDNQLILKVIETKLKKEGYDVISCENGKEAIEKITDVLPDLVITDIMLPHSSGLEIVNFVKVTLKQNIPVMVLSGMGQEKIFMLAYACLRLPTLAQGCSRWWWQQGRKARRWGPGE